jgi:hypothetical protein
MVCGGLKELVHEEGAEESVDTVPHVGFDPFLLQVAPSTPESITCQLSLSVK